MTPGGDAITPQGETIANLFTLSLVLSAAVFLLVAALMASFLYRGYRRREEPNARDENRRLEVIWTVAPLVLLAVLFTLSVRAMNRVESSESDNPLEITAIGHQWWWEFRYPDATVITANELHVPVHQPIKITITASDVIHSFWVPAIGWKVDGIPGKDNVMWLSVDETGAYDGACAEFCGTQHAWMRILVVAEPDDTFTGWLANQQQPALQPATDQARAAQQLFQSETCANCHTVAGAGATGDIGPDLTHLATRATLGAGVIENTPENLRNWIRDAQDIKPGVLMPSFTDLTDDELDALVNWLEGLK